MPKDVSVEQCFYFGHCVPRSQLFMRHDAPSRVIGGITPDNLVVGQREKSRFYMFFQFKQIRNQRFL